MQSVSHLGAERYSLIASKRIVSVDHTSSNSLAGSMAKKTAKASASAAGPIDTNATGLASDGTSAKDLDANVRQNAGGSLATDPLPTVRVNKANLGEIKSALDDIVKKYLTAQAFTPSLLHPTVHLSLGYTSIIFSLGSVLYSLRVPFEESKSVLWVGVVGYFVLQGILWAWKRWVEAGEVFQGKRRRIVKRIETDIVHVVSSTSLDSPPEPLITHSPHSRPSSPSTLPSPSSPTALSPASSDTALHSRDTSGASAESAFTSATTAASGSTLSKTSTSTAHTGPTYSLHLSLSTTSNNGKSLLHKSRVVAGRGIGEFVDVNGGVEEGEVERWISALLVDAGLVGAEEEGTKEE